MIGGLLLALVSIVLIGLTAFNLKNAIFKGVTGAYGWAYVTDENPTAFWTSVIFTVLGLLFGLALASAAIAGLLGAFA